MALDNIKREEEMQPRMKAEQESLSIYGMLEKWILAMKNLNMAMPKVDEAIDNQTIGFVAFVLRNRLHEDLKQLSLTKIESIVYSTKYSKVQQDRFLELILLDFVNGSVRSDKSASMILDEATSTPKDPSRTNDLAHISSNSSITPTLAKHQTEMQSPNDNTPFNLNVKKFQTVGASSQKRQKIQSIVKQLQMDTTLQNVI